MKRQHVALTAYVLSPIVVTVMICYAIAVSIKEPRRMDVPPIGAGAGNTGGANAIGERLAHGSGAKAPQTYSGKGLPAGYEAQPAGQVEPETLPQGFVLVVDDKSGRASPSSPIYLASNWGNWNPGDASFKLEPQSDMRWRIIVKRPAGRTDRLEFKFTRGDWALEELNQDMSAPGNRSLPMVDASTLKDGEQPKFEFTVPHWGDEKPENAAKAAFDPYRALKVTGDVRRLQVSGGATTAAGTTRELLVWLPPGYSEPANARAKYPVIYLHDGQHVFETTPGAAAEWKADEIATSLVTRHMMAPAIIVAVPNAGQGRNSEYMPVSGINDIPAAGQVHTSWLLNEVKPRVEAAFRVKTGPENTGIGGASLGAAISLYAATTHPETFGLLLAESLPLRTGEAKVWDSFVAGVKTWPKRVYLGMGGAELGTEAKNADRNKADVDAVRSLDSVLDKAGLGPDRRLLVVDAAGQHNEEAWSKRLPQALSFLFPPPMDGTK